MERRSSPTLSSRVLVSAAVALSALCLWAPGAFAASWSTTLRIQGDWQPKLSCDGCNPENQWEGSGAGNTQNESLLVDDLVGGEKLRFGALGGIVRNGTGRVDCVAGEKETVRVPQHTPLLQFLDAQGNVVPLQDDGYNGTQSLRVIDAMRTGATVPEGAVALWGSWPDTAYGDNDDLCYFTLVRDDGRVVQTTTVQTAPDSEPTFANEREASRRATVEERTKSNSRADLIELVKSGPAGVTGRPLDTLEQLLTHEARLLCRVQDRFRNPATLVITRVRLAERMGEKLGVDPARLLPVLESRDLCGMAEDVDIPTLPSTPSVTPQQPSAPAYTPVPSRPRDSSSSNNTSSVKPVVTVTPAPSTTTDQASSAFTLEAKLRLLCRIQQRGMEDSVTFRTEVPVIADRYAQRWNMSETAITAALLNSDLCDHPERISLEGLPDLPPEVPVVGSVDSGEPDGRSSFAAFFSRLPSLPPMVLIVGALTLATFITLIVLLLLPLLRKDK
jgi:hypothetical protein